MINGSGEQGRVQSLLRWSRVRAFLRATLSTTKIIDIRRARVRAVIRGATSSGGKEWLTVHLSAELRQIIVLILPPFSLYMSGVCVCVCARARVRRVDDARRKLCQALYTRPDLRRRQDNRGAGWRARVSGYRL